MAAYGEPPPPPPGHQNALKSIWVDHCSGQGRFCYQSSSWILLWSEKVGVFHYDLHQKNLEEEASYTCFKYHLYWDKAFLQCDIMEVCLEDTLGDNHQNQSLNLKIWKSSAVLDVFLLFLVKFIPLVFCPIDTNVSNHYIITLHITTPCMGMGFIPLWTWKFHTVLHQHRGKYAETAGLSWYW